MSDLIRRSDAIKAVWGDDINPSEDGMVFEAQSHIDRDIRLIPSADRPQEWIPCSERLPKKEEATYLICTETGHMCSCRWTNNMYGLRSNEWSKWGWHIMDKPQYARVVAWMPLPKPYKESDDE